MPELVFLPEFVWFRPSRSFAMNLIPLELIFLKTLLGNRSSNNSEDTDNFLFVKPLQMLYFLIKILPFNDN